MQACSHAPTSNMQYKLTFMLSYHIIIGTDSGGPYPCNNDVLYLLCSLTKNYELLKRRFQVHRDTRENLVVKLDQITVTHKYLEMELNKLRAQMMHLNQEKSFWTRYMLRFNVYPN